MPSGFLTKQKKLPQPSLEGLCRKSGRRGRCLSGHGCGPLVCVRAHSHPRLQHSRAIGDLNHFGWEHLANESTQLKSHANSPHGHVVTWRHMFLATLRKLFLFCHCTLSSLLPVVHTQPSPDSFQRSGTVQWARRHCRNRHRKPQHSTCMPLYSKNTTPAINLLQAALKCFSLSSSAQPRAAYTT